MTIGFKDPIAPTEVYLYTFGGCEGDSEVYFYVIDGGGHNLPGVGGRLTPAIASSTNMDIHAGEVIWDFFERHSRINFYPPLRFLLSQFIVSQTHTLVEFQLVCIQAVPLTSCLPALQSLLSIQV